MTEPTERDLLIEIRTELRLALQRVQDHETRLRALERARWVYVGAAGVAGGIADKLAAFL